MLAGPHGPAFAERIRMRSALRSCTCPSVPSAAGSTGWEGAVGMKDYGLRICEHGVVLRMERRRVFMPSRKAWRKLLKRIRGGESSRRPRGRVQAFSDASRRRLEFIAANVGGRFRSHLTLTYHANCENWEGDTERNGRIARRSKADLNRFLYAIR